MDECCSVIKQALSSTLYPFMSILFRKNAKEKDNKEPFQIFENHIFQEYTYKKITPCDICSQILRGKSLSSVTKIGNQNHTLQRKGDARYDTYFLEV